MELTLSSRESEFLLEMLEEHHRELLREIARTKHRDFREDLKHKVAMLESIVHKLELELRPETVLTPV